MVLEPLEVRSYGARVAKVGCRKGGVEGQKGDYRNSPIGTPRPISHDHIEIAQSPTSAQQSRAAVELTAVRASQAGQARARHPDPWSHRLFDLWGNCTSPEASSIDRLTRASISSRGLIWSNINDVRSYSMPTTHLLATDRRVLCISGSALRRYGSVMPLYYTGLHRVAISPISLPNGGRRRGKPAAQVLLCSC